MLWTLIERDKIWLVGIGEEENDRLAILRSRRGPKSDTGRFTREDLRERK